MWLLYSLTAAVTYAFLNIGMAALVRELPLLPVLTAVSALTTLMLLPFFIFVVYKEHTAGRKVIPNRLGLKALLLASGMDFLGVLMFSLALKWGPISVVTPLRQTVPLFSLIFAPRFLSEHTGRMQKIGIALVVLSASVLVWTTYNGNTPDSSGFTPPVLAALTLALGVAIISAFILIANKYATAQQYGKITPLIFTTLDHALLALLFAILTFLYHGTLLPVEMLIIKTSALLLIISLSALSSLTSFCIIKACQIGDTVKVSPVIRLSVLLSVIFGGALFVEAHLWLRIIASIVFIIGLLPVIIFQEKKKQTVSV
ncbi:MAG: DMT family transporter [bacterium]|nr:DMT family transporter [bacterium]